MPGAVEDLGMLERLYEQLLDPSERIIAFVGSGTSRAAPALVPTWVELFDCLCDKCAELGQTKVAERCRQIATLAEYGPTHLLACFDELQQAMQQTAFESAVKTILQPRGPGLPDGLRALSRIPFCGVITTNLDELIEEACEDASRALKRPALPTPIASNTGRGAGDLARRRNWLWKIHGTISEPESWVLSTSQYSKSIYGNEAYREALKTVVQSARLLFVGFGGSDPDIDRILTLLADRFGGRKEPHLLLGRSKEDYNRLRLANLNIQVIEYGGPEDHSNLPKLLSDFPRYSTGSRVATDMDDGTYRRWLTEDVGYIDVRGIGGGSSRALRFPILGLYTDLFVLRGPANWDLDEGRMRGGQRIELTRVVDTSRRVAIMGDPGSGKTTFLRYVARSYIDDPSKPLPFYFSLADVQRFAERNTMQLGPKVFLEFLSERGEKKGWGLPLQALRKRFRVGHCIFLLDSLDLVSPRETREAMVSAIEETAESWDKCQFVVVSRPRAMRGKAVPHDFSVVAIDHMRKPEVAAFVKTWADLLYGDASGETRDRYAEGLLFSIRDSSDLRELAKNPVMLTSIAVVHYNGKRLPEARADLLEAVIDWLLNAREAPGGKPRDAKFLESVYRQLALGMMEKPVGPTDRVERGVAADIVARQFRGDRAAALAFLAEEETETGILVARGEEGVAFWHMWFEEYLAAREISGRMDDGPRGWWAALMPHLDDVEWREVLSFVPACLSRMGPDRVDLFFARLAESSAGSDLATKARRVGLGDGILDDLRVVGYSPERVSEWTSLLNEVLPLFGEHGESLSLEDRYDAAVAFGRGGDSRLRDFEETWVGLPGGRFLMGAQCRDATEPNFDPEAAPWEGPAVDVALKPFEIRKYPITVAEFTKFIADGGYRREDLWPAEAWHWRVDNEIEFPQDWHEQQQAPNCPVTGLSWFEAVAYCRWLTSLELMRDVRYRLCSEAEWEYAARRGLSAGVRFPWGDKCNSGDRAEANMARSGLRRKTPLGMFPRSNTADGVTDMFGNVEEWCADLWTPDLRSYANGNVEPPELTDNPRRVVRGGSTIRFARLCRPSYRSRIRARSRYLVVGFRPVRVRGSEGT